MKGLSPQLFVFFSSFSLLLAFFQFTCILFCFPLPSYHLTLNTFNPLWFVLFSSASVPVALWLADSLTRQGQPPVAPMNDPCPPTSFGTVKAATAVRMGPEQNVNTRVTARCRSSNLWFRLLLLPLPISCFSLCTTSVGACRKKCIHGRQRDTLFSFLFCFLPEGCLRDVRLNDSTK
jgi:hypothetical protein